MAGMSLRRWSGSVPLCASQRRAATAAVEALRDHFAAVGLPVSGLLHRAGSPDRCNA